MQRRRSIYLDGFGHKNPIPAACMIDGLLMTGIIYGQDPETGKAADGLERQTELMFTHMRAILDAAGMTTEDILKVDVLLLDRSRRGPLNEQWEAMFPDPDNRPVRQAMQADLDNGKLIQCNVTARAAS
ncbi:MAG: hypothetical protein CML02_14195 [Pseudooceanicola sp.]|jgi:2-iminobutanoate/2-iminopropanoate deaminase|nr:hypothetical protein [Pseudooceanicola sp.]|tara:strand:- start:6 stop:392 length:387 start_codon:yes stop_codon:yes gene_type:complete